MKNHNFWVKRIGPALCGLAALLTAFLLRPVYDGNIRTDMLMKNGPTAFWDKAIGHHDAIEGTITNGWLSMVLSILLMGIGIYWLYRIVSKEWKERAEKEAAHAMQAVLNARAKADAMEPFGKLGVLRKELAYRLSDKATAQNVRIALQNTFNAAKVLDTHYERLMAFIVASASMVNMPKIASDIAALERELDTFAKYLTTDIRSAIEVACATNRTASSFGELFRYCDDEIVKLDTLWAKLPETEADAVLRKNLSLTEYMNAYVGTTAKLKAQQEI